MKLSDLNITPNLNGDGYFFITRGNAQKKATVSSVDSLLDTDALASVGGGGSSGSPVSAGSFSGVFIGTVCGGTDTVYLPASPSVGDKVIIYNNCLEAGFAIDAGDNVIENSNYLGAVKATADDPPAKTTFIYTGDSFWHMSFESN